MHEHLIGQRSRISENSDSPAVSPQNNHLFCSDLIVNLLGLSLFPLKINFKLKKTGASADKPWWEANRLVHRFEQLLSLFYAVKSKILPNAASHFKTAFFAGFVNFPDDSRGRLLPVDGINC